MDTKSTKPNAARLTDVLVENLLVRQYERVPHDHRGKDDEISTYIAATQIAEDLEATARALRSIAKKAQTKAYRDAFEAHRKGEITLVALSAIGDKVGLGTK